MSIIKFHQDLRAFQKSVEFAMMIYELQNLFQKKKSISYVIIQMKNSLLF